MECIAVLVGFHRLLTVPAPARRSSAGLDREKPGIEKLPVSIKSLLHLIETNKNSTALQFQDILLSL